jgi:cytochrome c-type biogenesis protein CcmF
MYMTLSSALPSWMPAGGQVLKAPSYNAIARPISILFCFILAVCPLLAWKKTSARQFLRLALWPSIVAVVAFVALFVYFVSTLLPVYMATMAQGGFAAQELLGAGSFFYYALLTLAGFLVACLLVFNALFMLVRAIRKRNLRAQTIGGFLAHLAIGVLLVGLIGSSMYTFGDEGSLANPGNPGGEHHGMSVSQATDTSVVRDYKLTFVSSDVEASANGDDVLFILTLAVEKNGISLGEIQPAVLVIQSTGMQTSHPAVLSSPLEDLFVVYQGVDQLGDYALDVRINPLIWFVWIGFGVLMIGTAVAAVGRRK